MTRWRSDGTPEEHVVFISIPASLMQKFCVLQPPGETIGDLGDAYVNNTLCGKKYESQVDQQRAYLEKVGVDMPSEKEHSNGTAKKDR